MDKLMEEEDLKGLEEEIDNAVDRLFVERKRTPDESLLMESPLAEPTLKLSTSEPSMSPPVFESPIPPQPLERAIQSPVLEPSLMESPLSEIASEPFTLEPSSITPPVLESATKPRPLESSVKLPIAEPSVNASLLESSYQFEKSLDEERPLRPPSVPSSAPVPVPFLKAIERMEAQLLSLEWEITGEKLETAREEILALKEMLKHKADMIAILGSMESVLSHMIKNEEEIRPPWIKFLLDAKETLKLLMRKETAGEINIYKQLACLGIEARFSCLEGMKDTKMSQPLSKTGEIQASGLPFSEEKKIGEMAKNVHLFMKRVEDIFGTIQQQIVKLEETSRRAPVPSADPKSPSLGVTIFKIDERLFGVETEKVFKLFKVPNTFEEKYSDQQKIRLRDFEVKMVDLKKLLAIQEGMPREQIRILTVKENGEYKGFLVDEVLKRVSILSVKKGEADRYFSGLIPFTYQGQAVEIPILDLKKF